MSQAPKETPKVRKFESYSAETYKTDEQKKEEVYTHFLNISFQTIERGKIRVFSILLKEIKHTPKTLPNPYKKTMDNSKQKIIQITVNFQCHLCISSPEKTPNKPKTDAF